MCAGVYWLRQDRYNPRLDSGFAFLATAAFDDAKVSR